MPATSIETALLAKLARVAQQQTDPFAPFEAVPTLDQAREAAAQYTEITTAIELRDARDTQAAEALAQATHQRSIAEAQLDLEQQRIDVSKAEAVVKMLDVVGKLPESEKRDAMIGRLLEADPVALFQPSRQIARDDAG